MACQRPLLLLLFVVLIVGTHLSSAQHWSHGWYPGGKRELDLSQTPEVSSSLSLGGSSILLESPQYSRAGFNLGRKDHVATQSWKCICFVCEFRLQKKSNSVMGKSVLI
uniref:Progonadoliberin n=1 Tax=Terrapene triunguis TaxID=2587831 RepID=A0A674HYG8_9SAUR